MEKQRGGVVILLILEGLCYSAEHFLLHCNLCIVLFIIFMNKSKCWIFFEHVSLGSHTFISFGTTMT